MNVIIELDPVIMRKVEKCAESLGLSVESFFDYFFCGQGGPTDENAKSTGRKIFLR